MQLLGNEAMLGLSSFSIYLTNWIHKISSQKPCLPSQYFSISIEDVRRTIQSLSFEFTISEYNEYNEYNERHKTDSFLLHQLLELRTNILNLNSQLSSNWWFAMVRMKFSIFFHFYTSALYANRIVPIITESISLYECVRVCAQKYEIRDVIRKQ